MSNTPSDMNELFQLIRLKLVTLRPYLGSMLWRVVPINEPSVGTMGVDKYWRLYYNPDFMKRHSVAELTSVVYHEMEHLLRDHAGRAEYAGGNSEVWNIAVDMEVNDDIRDEASSLGTDAMPPLPEYAVYPETFDLERNLLAEKYYDLIKDKVKTFTITVGVESDSGSGGARACAGNCGSGADGKQREWERPAPGASGVPGLTKAEADLIRKQIAEDIASGRFAGNVPASARRWAESYLEPKVDWRKELQSVIRHAAAVAAGATDYTYTTPSRRSGSIQDVVLPRLISRKPTIAIALDTSGSMRDDEIRTSIELGCSLIKQVAVPGAKAVIVDAEVHRVVPLASLKSADVIGGGGTDMTRAFDAVAKMRPAPDILVVFTDGYTPWPEKPPKFPAVAVLIGRQVDERTPSWLKTIKVGYGEK